jgi:hypothetical protein
MVQSALNVLNCLNAVWWCLKNRLEICVILSSWKGSISIGSP